MKTYNFIIDTAKAVCVCVCVCVCMCVWRMQRETKVSKCMLNLEAYFDWLKMLLGKTFRCIC